MKVKILSLSLIVILLAAVGHYWWTLDRISTRKSNGWEFSVTTIEQVEAKERIYLQRSGESQKPLFGNSHKQWEQLKSLYRPGDKVYVGDFRGRMENGEIAVAGSYLLVRGDVIVFEMTTYVS